MTSLAAQTVPRASTTVAFSQVQQGFGRLVAAISSNEALSDKDKQSARTHLTTVSHQAPVRLLPLKASSSVSQAAICYLSNYGGGLLPGDTLEYHVHVKPYARLGLLTQGSNRIYRQSERQEAVSSSKLYIHLDPQACLVVAPDPVTPFENSIYQQEQVIHASASSSLCLIDWFSSGRYVNGERWQQKRLVNQTTLYVHNNDDPQQWVDHTVLKPVFRDSMTLHASSAPGWDWHRGKLQFNVNASTILMGAQMKDVLQRCEMLRDNLLAPYTSVRLRTDHSKNLQEDHQHSPDATTVLSTLAGRVLMSVSSIPILDTHRSSSIQEQHEDSSSHVHLVRWTATSNEDMYRLLRYCLEPLAAQYGKEFYKDRIRAVHAAAVEPVPSSRVAATDGSTDRVTSRESSNGTTFVARQTPMHSDANNQNSDAYWNMFLLSDSALPVGGFAHSSGLEVASQIKLLQDSADVANFVETATRSSLQMHASFVCQAHDLVRTATLEEFDQIWGELDERVHSLLVSNGPACRASLDQGRSLLRVASNLGSQLSSSDRSILRAIQQAVNQSANCGHLSTTFGVVSSLLKISASQACQLLGYCTARDIVSAAVRLNLIGPLTSTDLLARAQVAANQGIEAGLDVAMTRSTCAPLLDVIQPCHDSLEMRLFRT